MSMTVTQQDVFYRVMQAFVSGSHKLITLYSEDLKKATETSEERVTRLQWMNTNQHERLAVEINPRGERVKVTANKHQPARKVVS